MSFESRANRAAHSINRSVATVRPAGMGTITKRHRLSMATAFAFAGIIAGASVAFAAMLPGEATEEITASQTTVAAESTTSTIPSEAGPPIVVLPADGQDPADTPEGQDALLPEGTEVLVLAIDDPLSLTGGGWDEWGYGIDGWETTTTTTEPEDPVDIPITAHQAYGPATYKTYEKIYGTAPPGTRVLLTSAYGSSDWTVGESGEYYLKVYFSGQPSNEYFPITARVGSKTYTFQFKWTGSFEVSASQYYGPENTVRKDKVYGTAPPGTIVIAESEYGSSDLTVGASGEYWLHIYFNESLPANEWITWTATLKNPSGAVLLTKTFDFKWVVDAGEASLDRCVYPAEYEERKQKVCGWAPPGAVVELTSEYGSVEQAVSGEYHVKLFFDETVPANEPITWTAKMWHEGEVIIERTYQYTWLAPEGGDVTMAQCVYPNPNSDPWQKICGWAPEGTVIDIISDHGTVEKAVAGEYYVKIHFNSSLPANTPITFTARAWIGGEIVKQQSFSFTWAPNFDESATQHYGECSDAEPYDKFSGTGTPGQAVTLTSPYGSASTTVGWDGKWSTKIWFTEPPPDTPFTITVQVGGSWSADYSFTWTPE